MRLFTRARLGAFILTLLVCAIARSLSAQGPTPQWSAGYDHYYSTATTADAVNSVPVAFNEGWNFRIVADSPITVANATITATPAVGPFTTFVTNAVPVLTGPGTYSWSNASLAQQQMMAVNLSTTPTVNYVRGFDAARTLTGGSQSNPRIVLANATEARTATVDITPQEAFSYMDITLTPSIAGPGAPVTTQLQGCTTTDGQTFQQSDGSTHWLITSGTSAPLTPQVGHEITCTYQVHNGASTDALWMPTVFVSASKTLTYAPVGGSSLTITSDNSATPPDPFGTAAFQGAPGDNTAQLWQNRTFTRGTSLIGDNRLQNRPPTVSLNPPSVMTESTTFNLPLTASGFDQDNDPLIYNWQIVSFTGNGPGVLLAGSGPNQKFYSNSDGPSTATIQVTVTDPSGASASATTIVTTQNATPQLFVPPSFNMGLGNTILPCATINDPGVNDSPWTVSVNWGDGSPIEQPATSPGSCAGVGVAHAQPTHLYTHAGPFTITWNVTDKDGAPASATTPVTIGRTLPNFTASAGPSPASPGQAVTFSMTVTRPASFSPTIAAPTGNVTFSGPSINTMVPLDATGKATFVTSTLPLGSSTITMTYNGDSNYNTQTTSRTVTVQGSQPSSPSVSVSASPNPVNYGSSSTFTVTVNGNTQVPTGSVSLFIPGTPSLPIATRPVVTSGTTGTATFTVGGLGVGTHAFQASYNSTNPGLVGGSATTSLTVLQPAAVPFSQLTPIPAGACLCTPTMMNTDVFGAEHWFAKAAGTSMTIQLQAVPVNTTDPGTVTMRIRDAAGMLLGSATASYPVGSTTPATTSVTVPTTAGDVYRVEITTPAVSLLQPHYRLKFEGALEAGLPSPSYNSFEEYTSPDVPQPWLFNVASGERLAVALAPPSVTGVPGPTTVTASLVNLAAPGILVPMVDPANPSGPSVTTVTVSSSSPLTGVPLTMATAASSSGVYALLLHNVNGHFRLSRQDAAADRGIYLSWFGSGDGSVKFNISGGNLTLPPSFQIGAEITHVLSGNDMGHRMLSIGVTDVDEADTGTYRLHFTAPEGFIVSPADVDVDVLCDQPLEINISIFAVTSTTVSAPAITFGQGGVVSVNVASPGGVVGGTVALSIDGGAPLTATLAGSAGVFNVPGLSAGTHSLAASYAQQGSFLASSSTGSIVVSPVATTTTVSSSANPATGPVTLTATVTPAVGTTPPVGTVAFYDGTTLIGSGTLSGGVATLTTSALALGPHTITAAYDGDANHLASTSAAINLLVYAYPGTGTFVIGDLNAAAGTHVTFWGAQWEKLNALSAGPANASFKGYASAVGSASWTTAPGNSSNPPSGPLPAYMGVIVTSQVTKSGSTISGGITKIVVVRTDVGYDDNPGHAGTGTVIALVP